MPEFANEQEKQAYMIEMRANAANEAAQRGNRTAKKRTSGPQGGKQSKLRRSEAAAAAGARRVTAEEEKAIANSKNWILALSIPKILAGTKLGCTVRQAKEGSTALERLGLSHEKETLDSHLVLCAAAHAMAVDAVTKIQLHEFKTHAKVLKRGKAEIPPDTMLIYIKRMLHYLRRGVLTEEAQLSLT